VRFSIATTLQCSKGGWRVVHASAVPGNFYDNHTLASIIPNITQSIRNDISCVLTEVNHPGSDAPPLPQVQGLHFSSDAALDGHYKARDTPLLSHWFRHRQIKDGHRMDCNYLTARQCNAINFRLAPAKYNFRILLNWGRLLLCLIASVPVTRCRHTAVRL
jgi:IS5 family transposase